MFSQSPALFGQLAPRDPYAFRPEASRTQLQTFLGLAASRRPLVPSEVYAGRADLDTTERHEVAVFAKAPPVAIACASKSRDHPILNTAVPFKPVGHVCHKICNVRMAMK